MPDLTPRQIVAGAGPRHRGAGRRQARRGRSRSQSLAAPAASRELRGQVTPKNIMLIGPTGVGKTEIARRLASLVGAPFVKVEATKYTEVGYYGRDVESLVRDLVEAAIALVQASRTRGVGEQAQGPRRGAPARPACCLRTAGLGRSRLAGRRRGQPIAASARATR